jgi:hypothetical protein
MLIITLPTFHTVGYLCTPYWPTHRLNATRDGCDSCVLCHMDRENGMSWGRESSLNETCSGVQEAVYAPPQSSLLLVLASLTYSQILSPQLLTFQTKCNLRRRNGRVYSLFIYLFIYLFILFCLVLNNIKLILNIN